MGARFRARLVAVAVPPTNDQLYAIVVASVQSPLTVTGYSRRSPRVI